MATKEEIEDIVKTTLETARKNRVGKIFQDPIKAENFGSTILIIAIVSIMVNAMVLSGWNEEMDKQKHLETTNVVLSNMLLDHLSCSELRTELENYYSGNSLIAQNVHIYEITGHMLDKKC